MHNFGEYGKGLAHSVGLPESMQEAEEGTKAATEVTPMNAIRAVGGPAVSAGEQVYSAGKGYLKGLWNTGKEAYEAGQNIAKGGPILQNIAKPASEYLNTNVGAVPFIGQPTVEAGKDIAAGTKDIVGMTPRAAGELTGVVGQVALPEVLDRTHPEQTMEFHDKAVAEAQKNLDTAKKVAEPYVDSAAKGVLPPKKVQAPIEKAQTELNEATFHRDTHRDAMNARRTNVINPKQPAAQPEMPTEQIEAMPRPGAPKPATTPENVKTPGQIRPERTAAEEPLQEKPQVPVGQRQLPNAQGTVGTQKLLTRPELPVEAPAAGTEPTPDWKTKGPAAEAKPEQPEFPMVRPGEAPVAPKAEAKAAPKAEAPAPKPAGMRDMNKLKVNEKGDVIDTSVPQDRLHSLLQQSLESEAPKANEAAAPKAKETPKAEEAPKEPVMTRTEEGREQPKGAAEYHPAVQQKVNELSDEKLRTLAKAHGLNPDEYDFNARDEGRHRTERDRLAREVTEQMGDDEKINLGRAAEKADKEGLFQGADTSSKGRAARAEKMFPRLRGPVDENGNPKIGGGAPEGEPEEKPEGALSADDKSAKETIANDKNMPKHPAEEAAAKATVGTEAAAKSDTEHFANAKKELGDKASISDIAKRAQEMKDATAQLEVHEKNGGSTFSSKGKDLNGTNNYSVGSYPERTEKVDKLTPERLDEFKKKNADVLSKEGHAVGTWKDPDTGKAVLDVTKLYTDRDAAIAAGKAANQKSIYHLGGEGEIQTGGTGEGPAKEGFPDKIERSKVSAKIPTGDQLIKKYGEASGVDPRGMTFILDDGRVVNNLGSDHDVMLGGKATDDKPRREQFVAGGNIRVRAHGKEVTFSIPASGVNAGQLAVIQKMSPQLRSGAVMFEVGDKLGSKYEAIPHGEATDERIEQTIQNITGKANPPKSFGSEFNPEKFEDEADKLNKPGEKKKPGFKKM
jgi:hypothetical protein